MTRKSATNVRVHLEDTYHTCNRLLSESGNLTYRQVMDLQRLMLMSDAILKLHTRKAVDRHDIYVERRSER